MDAATFERINTQALSIAADIREWNQQQLNARYQTIDIEIEQKAQTKVKELLPLEIEKSERLLVIQQKRTKLERQVADSFRELFFFLDIHLSRAVPALIILTGCSLISWGFGAFISLNLLPSAVGCPSVDSLCYRWRLNKDATIAPDKAAPTQRTTQLKRKQIKKIK